MATITNILSSALSSMHANQVGISVTSNNIANANDLNYARQRMVTVPAIDLLGTSGGLGVQVSHIESLRDALIERRILQEDSSRGGAETLTNALSDIEVYFTDGDGHGLQQYITNFFNSFQTLSSDPSSTSFRELVRTSGQAMTDAFEQLRGDLSRIQLNADTHISQTVDRINSLASQISHLSLQIEEAELSGHPSELRDRRTALVRELSTIAEVKELEGGGTYQLSIGSNRVLVLETQSFPLTTQVDTNGNTQIYSGPDMMTAEISNGELGAFIKMRASYVPGYLNALDQIAYNIAQEVNERHSVGYDLQGNTGINFFTPMASSVGAAALMTLSTSVAGDLRSIAASTETNGLGNQTAIEIGNMIFEQVSASGSIIDQYRSLVFTVASDVSNAEISLREHQALSTQLELRRQAMSGVSIDEETVQMLQFQRAYQASARLLNTVDELLQTALSIGA